MVEGIENWLYYGTDNCLHHLCIELRHAVSHSGCLKLGVEQTVWRKIIINEYN